MRACVQVAVHAARIQGPLRSAGAAARRHRGRRARRRAKAADEWLWIGNGAHRRLGIGIGVVVSDPNPPGPANEFAAQPEPLRSALRERSPNRAFDNGTSRRHLTRYSELTAPASSRRFAPKAVCSFSCQVRRRVLVGCETVYPSHLMCVCLEASPSLAAEGLVAFAVVGCQDADELLVEIDVDQRAGLDDAEARTDILDR